MNIKVGIITLIAASVVAGCASSVKPWEKVQLAKPEMHWKNSDPQSNFMDHIYFSKEASSGGGIKTGGGCGCN